MSFAMCSLTRAQHAGGYAFSSPLEVERWSPKTRCNITLFCCIRCKPLILRALCCIPAPCALPTAHRVQSTGFRTHEWKAKRGTGVRGKVLITERIGCHLPRAKGGGRGVRAIPFPEPSLATSCPGALECETMRNHIGWSGVPTSPTPVYDFP